MALVEHYNYDSRLSSIYVSILYLGSNWASLVIFRCTYTCICANMKYNVHTSTLNIAMLLLPHHVRLLNINMCSCVAQKYWGIIPNIRADVYHPRELLWILYRPVLVTYGISIVVLTQYTSHIVLY